MSIVKSGRIAAAIIAGSIAASLGGIAVANATEQPAEVAEVVEYVAPEVNGLATEQEAEAAVAVEAARIEAERVAAELAAAEAARVAAAAAAQAEAERVAAAQADAERKAYLAPAPRQAAPAPAPIDGQGAKYDPETDSMAHTICEVTAEGVAIPCP